METFSEQVPDTIDFGVRYMHFEADKQLKKFMICCTEDPEAMHKCHKKGDMVTLLSESQSK